MKKNRLFLIVLPISLLFASLVITNSIKEFKMAKAGGDLTLTFTEFYNNGNRNVLDLKAIKDNSIAVGWDNEPITQVSSDAFLINGNQTISDGYVKIQKTSTYKYELCIDAINWSQYNYTEGGHNGAKSIKEGDVVQVGGSWSTTTGWNITIPTFQAKWTDGNWEFVTISEETLDASFNKMESNNQNGFYIFAKQENNIPVDGWNTRIIQHSNDAVMLNDEATIMGEGNSKGYLTKVSTLKYYFGLNDINYSTLHKNRKVGDEVVLQGTWRYYVSPSNYIEMSIESLKARWNGSTWVNVPLTTVDLALTYSTGNNKEIDCFSSVENDIPYDDHWHERLSQTSNECISINGENKTGCPMIKVGPTTYIFYLGDISGYTAIDGDVVVIKGLWQYTLGFNANVIEMSFTFNGTFWLKTFIYNVLAELNAYKATINMSLYSSVNQNVINNIFATAEENILAIANVEEGQTIINDVKTNVANVKTLAQELQGAKDVAKGELDEIDLAAYRDAEKLVVQELITNGKVAIDACTTVEEVNNKLAEIKAAIAEVKTDAQLTEEEEALAEAKTAAINELQALYNSKDLNKYDDAGKTSLLSALNAGKEAINAATTIEEVNSALANAKAAINSVEEMAITPQEPEQPTNEKKGCGGSIVTASILLSIIATFGASLLLIKRKDN